MDKVMLLRHGESEANVLKILDDDIDSKYGLTDLGIGQADYMANELRGLNFAGVVSSPILRARETAEIVADKLALEVVIDNNLIEAGQGPYSQQQYSTLPARYREANQQELWGKIVSRMDVALHRESGNYVAVSHALPIRAITAKYLGVLEEPSAFGIQIELASASCIDVSGERALSVGSYHISERVRSLFS